MSLGNCPRKKKKTNGEKKKKISIMFCFNIGVLWRMLITSQTGWEVEVSWINVV